ncbi:hypothetical protein SpCBS45565_g05537 [Spizellomyces sp. 'palustris']|nr:hypothetical protein SpCBS45565_g05537 [Spizellomyces sp. 'palustris']
MLTSNPHAEVNLRRLLAKFESNLASFQSDSDSSDKGPFVLAKYQANISHLHRLLRTIEADSARKCQDSVLSEYRRRVEQLEDVLDQSRLLSSVEKTVSSIRKLSCLPDSDPDAAERVKAADRILKLQRMAEEDLRAELLESTREASGRVSILGSEQQTLDEAREELLSTPQRDLRKRNASPASALDTPEDLTLLLDHDKKLQEQMAEDMAHMAAQLKLNSLALRDGLKKESKVLDEAHHHLSTNVFRLQREGLRLGTLNITARSTSWMVWLTVLFVCIAFVFTFVVMRLFKPRVESPVVVAPKGPHVGEDDGWLW